MNWVTTILVGLLTSVIGGLVAGWLVLRKSEYDLKRMYAGQIYIDFHFLSNDIFERFCKHIRIIDAEVIKDIPQSLDELDIDSLLSLLKKLSKWNRNDLGYKLSLCNRKRAIESVNSLVTESVNGKYGFNKFFQKYPTQIIYFDKLYDMKFDADVLEVEKKTILLDAELDDLREYIQLIILTMLPIIRHLKDVELDIEYFRKARSWSWRILRG